MRPRILVMSAALAILILAAGFFLFDRFGTWAEPIPHAVILDGGEQFEGLLMELKPPRYLLQAEDVCLVLGASDIERLDGSPFPAARFERGDRVRTTQDLIEDVRPDGTVLRRSRLVSHRDRSRPLHRMELMGLGPHEFPFRETLQVFDAHQQALPIRFEETDDGERIAVHIEFLRPVLPGEDLEVTTVYEDDRMVVRDGDRWVYRTSGDYPDPRLMTRAVWLPAGATVRSVTPEPLYQGESDERPLIIWRRFFTAGELQRWEVRYDLGAE